MRHEQTVLSAAATAHAAVVAQLDTTKDALKEAILQALDSGMSEVQVSALSGISRVTVRKWRSQASGDDLRAVWLRLRTGGAWHLGGDAGRGYCGRKLYGELEESHGDQPAGRMCRACAQRRARGA